MHEVCSIILIGPMGVGKSSVGNIIAKESSRKFIDADEYIEKTVAPISWIIDEEGEEGFRTHESRCLRSMIAQQKKPFVLATGGGVVLRNENRKFLASLPHTIIVYLQASAKLLAERGLNTKKRPALAQSDDKYAFFSDMLQKREHLYSEIAHYILPIEEYKKNSTALAKCILSRAKDST